MVLIWGYWKEMCVSNFPFGHMMYTNDPIFSTIQWSWKESEQGSWNESKMNTFGDIFWTAGARVVWAPFGEISSLYY